MPELIRVDGAEAVLLARTTMKERQYLEVTHLESWIKAHPELIDPSLMVVTTQFAEWESATGIARERPDVLALSSSGELVVIELKREGDRNVHLQAITYGALAASFSRTDLARAHARWELSEHGVSIAVEEAEQRLLNHVEGQWVDSFNEIPRLVIVAESFPAQVLTTVQWLDVIAPELVIECHEYTLFHDTVGTLVSFSRIFPVEGLEDRVLRPAIRDAKQVVNENRKSPRSAQIIHDHQLIPPGSKITLEMAGHSVGEVVETVTNWLNAAPERLDVSWFDHPSKPLRWGAADDPDITWTPSALRNEIYARAGAPMPNYSAADAWSYEGQSLYDLARSVRAAD